MTQTRMERALNTVVETFIDYSMPVRGKKMLNLEQFNKMMKEELPNFQQKQKSPEANDNLFKKLDKDKDEVLVFDEFLDLVGMILIEGYNKMVNKT